MYVDVDYYTSVYKGKIPADEAEKIIQKSCNKIDYVTFNRIVSKGFENLTLFQQQKIKDAVCYQADYIYENGNSNTSISSYNVLDVSVNYKETDSSRLDLSTDTYINLKQTGLMCGVIR